MKKSDIHIRKPVFAGSFYPSTAKEIKAFIEKFNKDHSEQEDYLKQMPASVSGLIVPHAGWEYSGKTALSAFRMLEKLQPDKIAILGPGHRVLVNSAVRDDHEAWETPLGTTMLIQDEDFEIFKPAHAVEHSLEVQLPFIQYFVPRCKIMPLVVGQLKKGQVETLAEKLLDKGYFFIISTDLSHFYPIAEAHKRDLKSIENIERLCEEGTEACGLQPLRIAFAIMRKLRKKPHLINYSTSADANGDASSVVGYASFWM